MTEHPANSGLYDEKIEGRPFRSGGPQSVDKVSGQLLLCKNANRSCIAGRSAVPAETLKLRKHNKIRPS